MLSGSSATNLKDICLETQEQKVEGKSADMSQFSKASSKGPGKFRLSQSSGRDNIKAVRTTMRKKKLIFKSKNNQAEAIMFPRSVSLCHT